MAYDSSLLTLQNATMPSAPYSLLQTLGVGLPSFTFQHIGSTVANLNSDQIAQLQTLLVSLHTILAFQASASVPHPFPQATPASFVPNPPLYIPSTFPSPSFPSSFAFGYGTSHQQASPMP